MSNDAIKVMILDDEEGIIDYMHKILELKGYKTFTALDSNKAIEIYKNEHPDICLLDVHLSYSPLDGIEVLGEIRKMDPQAVCVMVTRITDQEKMDRAKELGAKDYLLKPVDTKDLLETIKRIAAEIKAKGTS